MFTLIKLYVTLKHNKYMFSMISNISYSIDFQGKPKRGAFACNQGIIKKIACWSTEPVYVRNVHIMQTQRNKQLPYDSNSIENESEARRKFR